MSGENEKSHLDMAVELDDMEKSVTSKEADFLDKTLKLLKARKGLTEKDQTLLEMIYEKYFVIKEKEFGDKEPVEEKSPDDDEVDEDDFV